MIWNEEWNLHFWTAAVNRNIFGYKLRKLSVLGSLLEVNGILGEFYFPCTVFIAISKGGSILQTFGWTYLRKWPMLKERNLFYKDEFFVFVGKTLIDNGGKNLLTKLSFRQMYSSAVSGRLHFSSRVADWTICSLTPEKQSLKVTEY